MLKSEYFYRFLGTTAFPWRDIFVTSQSIVLIFFPGNHKVTLEEPAVPNHLYLRLNINLYNNSLLSFITSNHVCSCCMKIV